MKMCGLVGSTKDFRGFSPTKIKWADEVHQMEFNCGQLLRRLALKRKNILRQNLKKSIGICISFQLFAL